MVVLGVVAGVSASGKPLRDGASALFVDGRIRVAIAEERLRREKFAGGWRESAAKCLSDQALTPRDVEVVAYSTCCDSLRGAHIEQEQLRTAFPCARVLRVAHHASHAWYSFAASGFETALIVISDDGGNVLSGDSPAWWECSREQTTYYFGSPAGLKLVGRDFSEPFSAGFGEAFRAVTKYLGWRSGSDASKTMALCAFGDWRSLGVQKMFYFDGGTRTIKSRLRYVPGRPDLTLASLSDGALTRLVTPRTDVGEFEEAHAHLASLVQTSYEDAVRARIEALMDDLSPGGLCLGGGVAYNCLANGTLAACVPRIYVPAAPGDSGQAIGNAVAAIVDLFPRGLHPAGLARPFLGPGTVIDTVDGGLCDLRVREIDESSPQLVARRIAEGFIVGVFRANCEFGARALGRRSIFADPRGRGVVGVLNRRKGRQAFMPFGASVLSGRVDGLFNVLCPSPTMQFAFGATPEGKERIPAIVHRDGTCRLQTCDAGTDPWMFEMLDALDTLTGVPVALNTSLNGPGEPIVETPRDAVALLRRGIVDLLVIGNVEISGGERLLSRSAACLRPVSDNRVD